MWGVRAASVSQVVPRCGLVAALVVVLLSSGCIAADSPVGTTAVTRGPGGQPVAMVEACGDRVAAIELMRVDVSAVGAVVGRWTPFRGRYDRVLSMEAPSMDWNVVDSPMPLDPGGTYSVRAETVDYIGGPTEFTLAQVEELGDGQALMSAGRRIAVDELESAAC